MNIRLKSLFSVGLLGLLCLMLPKAARADDFTFSFTGTLGTVTGEIFGLTNNTIGAATDVTITSFPPVFSFDPVLLSPTTDLFAPGWNISVNRFNEVNGQITEVNFFAENGVFSTDLVLNNLGPPLPPTFLSVPGTIIDQASLSSLVTAPVVTPESSSFSLMLIGLMALGTLVAVSTQKTGSALER